jgi:CobQ-like glutamine amidotransferase family enzyme
VGFKSQFSHSYGEPGCGPCFFTLRGAGLNPEDQREGFRQNRFLATYLQGPLLPLNPPFTKWLMGQMGVAEPALLFEDAAMDAYETRLKEFSDPNTGFIY